MAPIYLRGGIPRHINAVTGNNVVKDWPLKALEGGGGIANFLRFKVTGANPIVLSLTKAAAGKAPSVGLTLAVNEVVELPTEIDGFWTRSPAGASAFEAVAFIRRG